MARATAPILTATMPTADFEEARRLLCACNLAYGVAATGGDPEALAIVPPVLPSREVLEDMRAAVGFARGSFHAHQSPVRAGIDAFAYGESGELAILAFRGTLPVRLATDPERIDQIVADWLNNARVHLVDGQTFGLPGFVHRGYADSLEALWSSAGGLAELLPTLRALAANGRRLLITGHSKGGALAQLAALRLAAIGDTGLMPAAVHTFAAPRAGNHVFAQTFDRTFADRAWRFEFQNDLVPHLPPTEGVWFALQSALAGTAAGREPGALGGWTWAGFKSKLDAVGRIGTYESAGCL
ncbi:MAG: lipase family protein, partial [Gammaproteobacteria bacterium]|nr:lipase family protein [Gammaproteobacteria bacterium]